jgi:hypothetical protein
MAKPLVPQVDGGDAGRGDEVPSESRAALDTDHHQSLRRITAPVRISLTKKPRESNSTETGLLLVKSLQLTLIQFSFF